MESEGMKIYWIVKEINYFLDKRCRPCVFALYQVISNEVLLLLNCIVRKRSRYSVSVHSYEFLAVGTGSREIITKLSGKEL